MYTLDNGLRVFLFDFPFMKSTLFQLYTKNGRTFEDEKENGISHFIEHVTMKSTKNYPTSIALKDEIKKIGGYRNAFTNPESVYYVIRLMNKYFEKGLEALYEQSQNALINNSDIEKERHIISEEIGRSIDQPEDYMQRWLLPSLAFRDSSLGRHNLGTKENIQRFSQKELKERYGRFYTSKNMVLSVCTSLPRKDIIPLIEKYFKNIRIGDELEKKENVVEPQNNVIFEKRKISQFHVGFAFETSGYDNPKNLDLFLLTYVLADILHDIVRQKYGLTYTTNLNPRVFLNEGAITSDIATKKEKIAKVITGIYETLGMVNNNISDLYLEKARNSYMSNNLFMEEKPDWYSNNIVMQELWNQKIITPDEKNLLIEKITKNDLYALSHQVLDKKRIKFAFLGDIDEKLEKDIKSLLAKC